ncbi:LysR substrate-binding domain-containing protein [Streptomyces sp. NBC_00271]|uniref:LysR substrate-binding domain-containing protein n=1 Tax=Streptomyces sp. NBC_00271 TaxID=2975697 RepID=UPI002E2D7695|nr:LysR substrate-binding domain-containing protein [Streptomyces sp. NBC_00271]
MALPLADEEYLLVAAPSRARHVEEHPSAEDICTAVRDVRPVAYAEDLPIVRRYWRNVFGKQLSARAAGAVPNLYAVVSAVTAGAGYSVLPRSLCEEHLCDGRLALLHEPVEPPPLNTLFLVQRPAPTRTRTSYGSVTASNTRPGPGSRPSRPPARRVGQGRL